MKKLFALLVVAIIAAFVSPCIATAVTMSESELKDEIKELNNGLPEALDDDLIWESVVYSNPNIVFNFKFDESEIGISDLQPVLPLLKDMLLEDFVSDPDMNNFLKILIGLNKGMTFNFTGARSGKKSSFVVTVSELKRLVE